MVNYRTGDFIACPIFKEGKASEYLFEASILFLNGKHIWVMDRIETDWISMDEQKGIYQMDFGIPAGTKYFLVVTGVKGGREGEAIESFAAKGYRLFNWGKC